MVSYKSLGDTCCGSPFFRINVCSYLEIIMLKGENKLIYFGFANFSVSLKNPNWTIIEEYSDGTKKCYNLDGSFYGSLSNNQIRGIIDKSKEN